MELLHSQILGTGQPLVILHGFLGMGDNWKTLGKRFATEPEFQNYEVHLIDQRNHGRSFHHNDFNYELLVQDLLVYIEHYSLENIVLLGHSMGGKAAMLFAVYYPEKVKNLIVADIGPKFYPNHHEQILAALQAVDFSTITSRGQVEEVLKERISENGIRQFLLKNVYRPENDKLAFRFNLSSLIENYDEVGVALPVLSQYNGETLFLKGEESGYISEEDEPLIKAHFKNSTIVIIANAGHWLHAENPDAFYDNVVSFLKRKSLA